MNLRSCSGEMARLQLLQQQQRRVKDWLIQCADWTMLANFSISRKTNFFLTFFFCNQLITHWTNVISEHSQYLKKINSWFVHLKKWGIVGHLRKFVLHFLFFAIFEPVLFFIHQNLFIKTCSSKLVCLTIMILIIQFSFFSSIFLIFSTDLVSVLSY